MNWKLEDLTALGDTSGMTEVFAQQDIPRWGIEKGAQGFRLRSSLVFAVVKDLKGPDGEILAKALDYDPDTSIAWWDSEKVPGVVG
jgi:hypothetical protein